ncbi:hypothetical protein Hanom_Chr08g00730471 [Helianthus anomalus]
MVLRWSTKKSISTYCHPILVDNFNTFHVRRINIANENGTESHQNNNRNLAKKEKQFTSSFD